MHLGVGVTLRRGAQCRGGLPDGQFPAGHSGGRLLGTETTQVGSARGVQDVRRGVEPCRRNPQCLRIDRGDSGCCSHTGLDATATPPVPSRRKLSPRR